MSRLLDLMYGRVHGWFSHTDGARFANRKPAPRHLSRRARLFLTDLEDRTTPNITVTNLLDSGAGSLRTAITSANSAAGADTIDFDPALFTSGAKTISIATQLPQAVTGQALTITGPGSNLLTINRSGSGSFVPFFLNGVGPFVVSNVTISGFSNSAAGGAFFINTASSNFTLTNSVLSGNTGTTGGGIYLNYGGTVTITNSTLSNNSASSSTGGALRSFGAGPVSVTGSTFTGNKAAGAGGALSLASSTANLTVSNSTFSGNSAAGTGGAINISGSNALTITNTTLSSNTSDSSGGAISNGSSTAFTLTSSTISGNKALNGGGLSLTGANTVTLNNSTIVSNTATNTSTTAGSGGGGITRGTATGTAVLNIVSTIIGKNTSANTTSNVQRPDIAGNTLTAIQTTWTINANKSLIGAANSITLSGSSGNNQTGTIASPLDPNLGGLANNGGTTLTHLPNPGSPVIDNGSNTLTLTTDQRGGNRTVGSATDIGSVERVPGPPTATAGTLPNITTSGGTSYTFTVSYAADSAINVSSIGTVNSAVNNITVVGPGGAVTPVTLTNIDVNTNGTPRVATYTFTPPGGTWDGSDNGSYAISTTSTSPVTDTSSVPVVATSLGSFTVALPLALVVSNANDTGAGSLRAAITATNSNANTADTISFDSTFFATAKTITLASSLPLISDNLTITGPGVSKLTVAGAGNQILNIQGAGILNVFLSDMTLSGGSAASGGAVGIADEIVTFTNMSLVNNTSSGDGGAINTSASKLFIINSNISNNKVTGVDSDGGAVAAQNAIALTLTNSTISGNSVAGDGGGIYTNAAGNSFSITGSTISGNTADGEAGGIYAFSTLAAPGFIMTNSTISGNLSKEATTRGGAGILFTVPGTTATITISNSTVVNNTSFSTSTASGAGAGGIAVLASGTTVTLASSIVANNSSASSKSDLSTYTSGATVASILATNSAIGDSNGFTLNAGSANNLAYGINLKLGVLANNGGATLTHMPAVNSPLLDVGSNPTSAATDQIGNPRVDVAADIGSVETGHVLPTADSSPSDVTTDGGTLYTFSVTYAAAGGINASTIGAGDITVTGPNGFSVTATFVSVDDPTNGTPRVGNYSFVPPGNTWDGNDNGVYTLTVIANAVKSVSGVSVPNAAVATFNVSAPVPVGVASALDVTTAGVTTYTFTVTYTDPTSSAAINISTLNTGDVTVTGPNGFSITPTFVSVDLTANGSPAVATYSFTPPGNVFDGNDNGLYTVALAGNQVFTAGGTKAQANANIGTFNVGLSEFVVLNSNDAGFGSFRSALANANAHVGADTITFDPTFFSTSKTIARESATPQVSDSVTITGPGAGLLTISGFNTYTGLYIYNSASKIDVSISNLTITGGVAANGDGAGIRVVDENLTLDSVVITGNNAGSVSDGGGVGVGGNSAVTINNSTISGNSANDGAAIYFLSGGTLTMTNSTISSNVSTDASANSGAIYLYGTTATILNSTITGNTANTGSAIVMLLSSNLTLQNSTITLNSATSSSTSIGTGGAIGRPSSGGTLTIVSSVVSGNIASNGRNDISDAGASLNLNYSAVFDGNDFTLSASSDHNLAFGVDAKLGALAFNPTTAATKTHLPSSSSPLLDRGSNPTGAATDQRGAARTDIITDIGSVEAGHSTIPTGAATSPNVTTAGGTTQTVTVVYTDAVGIKISSLGTGDITVSGPNGFTATPTFVSVDLGVDGSPATATYTFTAPGGTWDFTDNGTYSISLAASEVFNTNNFPALAGVIGSFTAANPGIYAVTNANDSGAGSLRDAITKSNASAGLTDAITFDPTFFASSKTITLATVLPTIADSVTITGTNAGFVTVSGNNAFNVFTIDNSASKLDVTIENLTITSGTATSADGAGIQISNENLTLNNVVITGNKAGANDGGGIGVSSTAALFINNSTISGNSANDGAGIYFFSGGSLVMNNSTISNNVATDTSTSASGGGALYLYNTLATINNSTISGNTAIVGGGIVSRGFTGSNSLIQNSTITANSATAVSTTAGLGGGGIARPATGGTITIVSSIVSGNASSGTANDDIADAGASVDATYSAIFDGDGFTISTGSGNLPFGTSIGLQPLSNNKGPTLTHNVSPGSPLIDAGTNPTGAAFDQRGPGYPRETNGKADIGAVERVPGLPTANLTAANITTDGATSYTFTVTYADDTAIKVSTLDNSDIIVTGPNGYSQAATFVNVDVNTDGSPRVATYSIPAPGGIFEGNDNGVYTATLQANQVTNTVSPTPVAVAGGSLGTFTVAAPRPTATASTSPVNALNAGQTTYTFTVTYADTATGAAINVGTLDGNDVKVTGPNGFNVAATFVSVDVNTNGSPRVATYSITVPSGGWAMSFNGTYTVAVQASQVANTAGTFVAAGSAGTFTVNIGQILTVLNSNDSGTGSLRDALATSNASVGVSDVIVFDPTFFATSKAITLTTGEMAISDSVTINGPSGLTVSGNGASRIFNINGTGTLDVFMSNMLLTAGSVTNLDGGAILVADENLTLDRVNITNSVTTGGNYRSGGAISVSASTSQALVTIRNSTLSGNSASGVGGAIYFPNRGGLLLENSTISGNVAGQIFSGYGSYGGGGIFFGGTVNSKGLNIRNSTIAGNTAQSGGGVQFEFFSGAAVIQNSTISGNTATSVATSYTGYYGTYTGFGGGGVSVTDDSTGTVTAISSIIAGNTSANANTDIATSTGTPAITATNSAIGSATGFTLSGASANNLAYGIDLKLGTLASNGGPTQTIGFTSNSPLVDAGTNLLSLATDQRGLARVSGAAADIGAFELQSAPVPTVTGIVINGGNASRSRVTSITVSFNTIVTPTANAFTLTRPIYQTGTAAATLVSGTPTSGQGRILVSLATVAGHTVATLTFATNAGSTSAVGEGVEYGSLDDGSWVLKVTGSAVTNVSGAPMAADFLTDNTADTLYSDTGRIYRLFGNEDGDTDVDLTDLSGFRTTFSSVSGDPTTPPYNPNFDFDADGDVDLSDLGAFRTRFTLLV